MSKTLKEASIIELKAEVYDATARIQREQSYIEAINKELELRNREATLEVIKEANTQTND